MFGRGAPAARALSWAATAPPACAPLVGALIGRLHTRRLLTLERAGLNRDTVPNRPWKVRQGVGSLMPGDSGEIGTSPGRLRRSSGIRSSSCSFLVPPSTPISGSTTVRLISAQRAIRDLSPGGGPTGPSNLSPYLGTGIPSLSPCFMWSVLYQGRAETTNGLGGAW